MPSLNVLPSTDRSANASELARLIKGEVRFDEHSRLLWSTDASLYQVKPIGVVIPADADDVMATLNYCAAHRLALLPRGGGTSLGGQCTAQAVVMDLSPRMRAVRSIDAASRICIAEPGIAVDELNRHLLAATGNLMFAPDPATVAQATIGGCIGNNAAGARSIRYGRTSENIAGIEVGLTSGQKLWLEPGAGRANPIARNLAQSVIGIVTKYAALIRERFPKTIRRNAGYGLDLILKQLEAGAAADDLDLSGLICGSEGTLAAVLAAKLKLNPVPKFKGLAIASFPSLEASLDTVNPILTTNPSAVELLDDVVLGVAAANNECKHYLRWLPQVNGHSPAAVLYVEYTSAESADDIVASFEKLRQTLPGAALATYIEPRPMNDLWALRKAGEPLLHGLPGHRKPHTFVEDNAVPVENLPRFVKEFKEIVARHGTTAAYYAHASVGVLHVRPLVNLHDKGDRDMLRRIAVDVADLARACGGVMSGEHGDGRIRGPLLERFFGPELMMAFRETKNLFDAADILNPGNIVSPGPIESITDNFRIDPVLAGPDLNKIDTFFDYADQDGFGGALEMCNGAGVCRKTAGGAMCPSYRATLDERHATRGRGNALRTALSGQASADRKPLWDDAGTIETLDLCLSCKACKSECPTNVDIARLKAEYTAQRYRTKGAPVAAKLFGHVRTLNKLGAMTPRLSNWFNKRKLVRAAMNKFLNLAPKRSIPAFSKSLYTLAKRSRNATVGTSVVLFGDCFVTYNESHIGLAAVKLLEALGYHVIVPRTGCCGRAMISNGLLPDAIRTADATLAQLKPYLDDQSVKAVLVVEPSCLSSFKDDWLNLKLTSPPALREKLAAKSLLVEEFVEKYWDQHPTKPQPRPTDAPVVLHGHCHQKALWGDATSSALIRRLVGDKLTVLPSGCCGMAGAFGYTADRYDVSMKIGELSVFPPIRAAAGATVLAPGTSCRHQIHDGTGRHALHPIEFAAQLLA